MVAAPAPHAAGDFRSPVLVAGHHASAMAERVGGNWHAHLAMAKIPTLRFHVKYGPAPLFDKARLQLKALAGLDLEIPHALSRFEERGIPLEYLAGFQPGLWDLVTVETNLRSGRITYMSLQRRLESKRYLWIVLAFEHVITAWIADTNSNRATNPLIVRDGPAWDAAAEGRRPKWTQAVAEWEPVHARQVRARRTLIALAHQPECPSGDRLDEAARLVLAGATWDEAAVGAGWPAHDDMDGAIERLLQTVKPSRPASEGE
ncbi:hypothetical protein [Mycobacteroides abscessus]|uniref:hypothetical protein n=1 Tax=Mycobacteroides abscessus TaxID=36809 RepID=UPI0009D27AB7|nr:hypothetical protein [Mycobacteroides abscessus]SKT79373.1 Uncharacterised protein [Mycobacteroides abscessus subsp. massiliense]